MMDMGSKRATTKCIATALVCQPCWVSCKLFLAKRYGLGIYRQKSCGRGHTPVFQCLLQRGQTWRI